METLRRILSRLVKDGGHFVEIQENQKPLLHLATTTQTLDAFQPLSASWIQERIEEILPREAEVYQAGRPVEGRLVIKNVGSLFVLACQKPLPCLVFFMPNYESELERYKKNLPKLDMEFATQSFPELPSLDIRTQHSTEGNNWQAVPPPPPFSTAARPVAVSKAEPLPDLFASSAKEPPSAFSLHEEKTILPPPPVKKTAISFPPSKKEEIETPTKMHALSLPEELASQPKEVTPPFILAPLPPVSLISPSMPYATPLATKDALADIDYAPTLASVMSWSQGQNSIDPYLREIVEKKASDLHLTTGQSMAFRKDGDIQKKLDLLVTSNLIQSFLDPIIPPLQRGKFATTWDIDFAYEIENVGRFRVNLFREQGGVGAVFRHIPQLILTAEALGLPPSILKFGKLNKGLVLITGPTGSGKTTTLAALIENINTERPVNIITIEDPIEFSYHSKKALIRQREVGKHTNSFSAALRASLREDPDIILIGELRDAETTAIAIETAETGHLVFGTLHTNSAVSTVSRIIDQFSSEKQPIIRSMLAASLKGVVTQTLVKKIGGGRCAAVEMLIPDDAVATMIREGKTHMIENHMLTQKASGNQLLNEALLQLTLKGTISSQEAWQNALDRKSLEDIAKRKNISFLDT